MKYYIIDLEILDLFKQWIMYTLYFRGLFKSIENYNYLQNISMCNIILWDRNLSNFKPLYLFTVQSCTKSDSNYTPIVFKIQIHCCFF